MVEQTTLNPSGTKLLGIGRGSGAAIVDTATGEVSYPQVPTGGYNEASPHAWLDDETYVATATKVTGTEEQRDLLTCDIGNPNCRSCRPPSPASPSRSCSPWASPARGADRPGHSGWPQRRAE